MAHLLIIGGSGFFGKSILDCYRRGLLNRFSITAITVMARNADRLLTEIPDLLDDSITLLNADIAKCTSLPFADIVIHAAASTDERNYIARAQEERANIQVGTYNFCKLAPQFCKGAKIVYVSSGAVYGQQPPRLATLSEVYEPGPVGNMSIAKRDYAEAKRCGESAIHELSQEGLNISVARCFSFVGAYLPRDQHFAIGNFIENGLNNQAILVKAANPVIRSYMYADDLVQWLMVIADNATYECGTYNVGSDESIQIEQLARKIGNYFNVSVNMTEMLSTNIDRYVPCIERAKNALGLSTTYNLDKSIEATIIKIQRRIK